MIRGIDPRIRPAVSTPVTIVGWCCADGNERQRSLERDDEKAETGIQLMASKHPLPRTSQQS